MNNILKYLLASSTCSSLVASKEPNPPIWDTDKVKILDNHFSHENQEVIDNIFKEAGAKDLGG